jgi:hypothetical protein
MRVFVLLAGLLLPIVASGQVKLEPTAITLQVRPLTGQANGILTITLTGDTDPSAITLRGTPLAAGDSYAFIQFGPKGEESPDLKSLNCQNNIQCRVAFSVTNAWKTGLYQGKITAESISATLASVALTAVRTAPTFQPAVTSDALKNGRLVVDVTQQPEFLLSVQNPQGVSPQDFLLTGHGDLPPNCVPISFSPDHFHLEPGAAQTVIASVQPCVPQGDHFLVLRIADGNQATGGVAAALDTVVAVSRHAPSRSRTAWLLGCVLLGAVISVALNNIFPVSRARNALRASLHQVRATLRECGQSSAALLDGLTAEARRVELSLKQVYFFSATKGSLLQSAQASVASLATTAALARRISQTRSAADSTTLSISMHAQIRQKLRDAEDDLRAGDANAASDRLDEAQAKLTEAQKDVQQSALTALLGTQLRKIMTERGRLVPPPQAAADGAAAVPSHLEQDPARMPLIARMVEQLAVDLPVLGKFDARDALEVERDLYIVDIWTEYVEPKLATNPQRFGELAASLLDSMLRNPKSEHVQTLLDLLRSETTPEEIALSLAKKEGDIVCDLHPRPLESVDIAFVFTHPALQAVTAAKRLLIYDWDTGDETAKPPSVDRFSHYFRMSWRESWMSWRESWRLGSARSYDVTLAVRVPFTSHTETFGFVTVVTPRVSAAGRWLEPMDLASFVVTAAIAVATAFGTQYASGLPDVITWPAGLSAFMLGFGLDQLRDTISPAASAVPSGNASVAAAAPPAKSGGA